MKKIKLFLMALLSLLLPSCSSSTSPSQDSSVISGKTEKLNTNINSQPRIIDDNALNNIGSSNSSFKLPASGLTVSGDNIIYGTNDSDNNIDISSTENDELIIENNTEADNSSDHDSKSEENLLGSYSSKVYTKTEDRQKNLRIVCEKLSGTILSPNEEFSYNQTCGPYNKENGFGKATVFLGDGTEIQDYGGGVCQLSSTLYNAVKDLNIEIIERHKHSKKVYYVPDGQDATVSYGNLDFKFKNKNNYSIRIEATSNAEAVNVSVYKV